MLGMETHRGRRVWSPFSPLENRKALPHGHTLRHCYTCLLVPLNIWFPSVPCSGPGKTETLSLSWLLTQQSRAGGSQNGKHQGLILRCLTLMNMQRPSNLRLALTLTPPARPSKQNYRPGPYSALFPFSRDLGCEDILVQKEFGGSDRTQSIVLHILAPLLPQSPCLT